MVQPESRPRNLEEGFTGMVQNQKGHPRHYGTEFVIQSNIKFEKHEELYKKYRNYIIELGKEKYITASEARKGLAGDACAIIRIHKFLEKWGLVNYIHLKPGTKVEPVNHKETAGR